MEFLYIALIIFAIIYFLVPFFIWSLLYHINEKMDTIISRINNNVQVPNNQVYQNNQYQNQSR